MKGRNVQSRLFLQSDLCLFQELLYEVVFPQVNNIVSKCCQYSPTLGILVIGAAGAGSRWFHRFTHEWECLFPSWTRANRHLDCLGWVVLWLGFRITWWYIGIWASRYDENQVFFDLAEGCKASAQFAKLWADRRGCRPFPLVIRTNVIWVTLVAW